MEFHRYPQIIRAFFNRHLFGPPPDFTLASTCPWVGHPVSGLLHATIFALFRLGFPPAPDLQDLNLAAYNNSPDRSTKSTLSGLNALQLLVNTGFQVLFHSPPGVLFTFPSRYCSTIGHRLVFSLGRWSSLLPTRFPVSRGTLDLGWRLSAFRVRDCHPLWSRLSFRCSTRPTAPLFAGPQPHTPEGIWFGLLRFRSPLLTESLLFSFPEGTKMFQFPSYPLIALCVHAMIPGLLVRVGSPIRKSAYLRIFAPPRGLSQLITSFIGYRCLGIHPVPLVA